MGAEASLRRRTDCTLADLEAAGEGMKVVGGVVTALQKKWTKKGDLMAVFTLEDLQSSIEVIEVMVFPKTMRDHGQKLADDVIVIIKGRLDDRDDLPKLIAMEVEVFEPIDDRQRPLEITLPPTSVTESLVTDLKRVLSEHPGESQVVLNLGAQKVRLPEGVDTSNGLVPELRVLLGSQAVLV
jgi:DNA polymerase-3 subunit alpha